MCVLLNADVVYSKWPHHSFQVVTSFCFAAAEFGMIGTKTHFTLFFCLSDSL